jgi:uncharacterized membrane protein (DUF485 family)
VFNYLLVNSLRFNRAKLVSFVVGMVVFCFVFYFAFSVLSKSVDNSVYVPLTEEEQIGSFSVMVGVSAIVASLCGYFSALGVKKKLIVKDILH